MYCCTVYTFHVSETFELVKKKSINQSISSRGTNLIQFLLIQFLFRIAVKLIEILNIDYDFQKKNIKLLNVFSRLFTKSHLSSN